MFHGDANKFGYLKPLDLLLQILIQNIVLPLSLVPIFFFCPSIHNALKFIFSPNKEVSQHHTFIIFLFPAAVL